MVYIREQNLRNYHHRNDRRMCRVSFGGLGSLARIFSPSLARKSRGFARNITFWPESGHLKILGGGGGGGGCSPIACPPPMPITIIMPINHTSLGESRIHYSPIFLVNLFKYLMYISTIRSGYYIVCLSYFVTRPTHRILRLFTAISYNTAYKP